MKALQVTCIVGAVTLTGIIYLVGGNRPVATVPDAMPEAAVNAETPALFAAVPEATAGPGTALGAELGSVTAAVYLVAPASRFLRSWLPCSPVPA